MGCDEEEWVKAAMTDDAMVVDLLVRLHGAVPTPPPPPPTLHLEWTVRQRRSRPVTVKLARSQRASPSTPLSWSGATSLSGGSGGSGVGCGGSEESSRSHIQNLSAAMRSKLNGDIQKAVSKMARKKKTLVELKDEENSLLKERRKLKRELSAERINLEKQRAKSEKWKRMKVELQPLPNKEAASPMEESVSDRRLAETTAGSHPIPPIAPPLISGNAAAALVSSSPPDADAVYNPTFMLPDLNMPLEDPCPDVICSVC